VNHAGGKDLYVILFWAGIWAINWTICWLL